MSDFEDLCDYYGLSTGDPDAIDKIIEMNSEPEPIDDEDLAFIEGIDFDNIDEDTRLPSEEVIESYYEYICDNNFGKPTEEGLKRYHDAMESISET